MTELFSISDVATKLHISEITLYRFIKKRIIPFRKIGRRYFFTNDDLKTYLDKVSYQIVEED